MKRCALYLRVSTEKQAEADKASIPTQRQSCLSYAKEQGWSIVEDYIYEEADSGYVLWGRPVLEKLRQDAADGKFDVVLVHSLERLSRNQSHLQFLYTDFEQYGVEVDSATEEIDNSPIGKFTRSAVALSGEIERIRFIDRSLRGRKHRVVDKGQLHVMGHRIFGYDFTDEKKTALKINDEEAYWVRRVFEEVASGTSLRKVGQMLRDAGVQSTRGTCTWGVNQIKQMIENEVYKGDVYAFKYESVEVKGGRKKAVLKPKDQWVKSSYKAPVIIEEALWKKAQRERGNPFKAKSKNDNRPVLLDGHKQAICGFCNAQMSRIRRVYKHQRNDGTITEKEVYLYKHNISASDRHGCSKFSLQADLVDNAILEYFAYIAENPEKYIEGIAQRNAEDPTKFNRESVAKRLKKVKEDWTEASKTFALTAAKLPEATRDLLIQDLAEKENQVKELEAEMEYLEEQHQEWKESAEQSLQVIGMLKKFSRDVIEEFTWEEKKALMWALGAEVRMFPKVHNPQWSAKFKFMVGTEDSVFDSNSVEELRQRLQEAGTGSFTNRTSTERFYTIYFDSNSLSSWEFSSDEDLLKVA